jgi:hypothetical protein
VELKLIDVFSPDDLPRYIELTPMRSAHLAADKNSWQYLMAVSTEMMTPCDRPGGRGSEGISAGTFHQVPAPAKGNLLVYLWTRRARSTLKTAHYLP